MHQNNKCRLCGDEDKMINHFISKCSKPAIKEYKSRHNWVVIHWQLCKNWNLTMQTNNNNNNNNNNNDNEEKKIWPYNMHKPESIMENETHKILWDFEIKTDHLILARRPDLLIISKKENLLYSGIFPSSGPLSENQRKWKERQVLGTCQRTNNVMEHESNSDSNFSWCAWNSPQRIN